MEIPMIQSPLNPIRNTWNTLRSCAPSRTEEKSNHWSEKEKKRESVREKEGRKISARGDSFKFTRRYPRRD